MRVELKHVRAEDVVVSIVRIKDHTACLSLLTFYLINDLPKVFENTDKKIHTCDICQNMSVR